MEWARNVAAARALAVMVRVRGPDPKGKKLKRFAFYKNSNGYTTISASGMLLLDETQQPPVTSDKDSPPWISGTPEGDAISALVVTSAAIIQTFSRQLSTQTSAQDRPELLATSDVHVLLQGLDLPSGIPIKGLNQKVPWMQASLVAIVGVPEARSALDSLTLGTGGGATSGSWELGWALAAAHDKNSPSSRSRGHLAAQETSQPLVAASPTTRPSGQMGRLPPVKPWNSSTARSDGHMFTAVPSVGPSTTDVAVLRLTAGRQTPGGTWLAELLEMRRKFCSDHQLADGFGSCATLRGGDQVAAIGSPFGAVSPLHFSNSVSIGVVSNQWPPGGATPALLTADFRGLPGMEGGPVVDMRGIVRGLLLPPIRQVTAGAEVQLFVASDALARALRPLNINLRLASCPNESCALATRKLLTNSPLQAVPAFHEVRNNSVLGGASSAVTAAPRCRVARPPLQKPPPWFGGGDGLTGSPTAAVCANSVTSSTWMGVGIRAAMESTVLVRVGQKSWASGVVLSSGGLILTNAHLLEPWRFNRPRRAASQGKGENALLPCSARLGETNECQGSTRTIERDDEPATCHAVRRPPCSCARCCVPTKEATCGCRAYDSQPGGSEGSVYYAGSYGADADASSWHNQSSEDMVPNQCPGSLLGGIHLSQCRDGVPALHLAPPSSREQRAQTGSLTAPTLPISVRMDSWEGATWHEADVCFVSQGPLDVALLQLRNPVEALRPIGVQNQTPLPGSRAFVIGHGLFAPNLDLKPSVSGGVVARIVTAAGPLPGQRIQPMPPGSQENFQVAVAGDAARSSAFPAMLHTTAVIHSGCSGGPVVDQDGLMIGLVTSNARHSGGLVLPHLNFSVPCAALSLVFAYAASSGGTPVDVLLSLNQTSEAIAAVWAQGPSNAPQPKPLPPTLQGRGSRPWKFPPGDAAEDRHLPVLGERSVKGARFARFLEDAELRVPPVTDSWRAREGGEAAEGGARSRL